jgi:subtilisin-like proprotein convertase family protein
LWAVSSLSSGAITSGTYKPTDLSGNFCRDDNFAAPAPGGRYPVTLSGFNGLDPNGDWQLYVRDDCDGAGGSLGSWSITLYVSQQPAIFAYGGSGQSTGIATNFATPLKALVKDASGNALAGASVTFTAPASGASGTFAGGSRTYTGTTDASGIVTATAFTANTTAGSYTVTATTSVSSLVANFNLTNTAGNPNSISATSGNNQNGNINATFAQPLVATVYDVGSNVVSSQVVTFTAPTSGATGAFAGGSNVYVGTTDASGRVTTTLFTANSTTGTYAVTATVAGVSTPASFTLTNNPPSTVQFQSSSYSVNEGIGTAVITLTRGVNSNGAITATVVISDNTTSSADYSLLNLSGGLDSTFNTTTGS